MKKLTKYFSQGLLSLVPIGVTIWVFHKIFIVIDGFIKFDIPGLGFIVMLITITVIGFIVSHLLTKTVVQRFEKILNRMPLVKMIYNAIKDLIGAFVGEKKSFNKPVLVSLTHDHLVQVIGFMTKDSLDNLGLTGKAAVYIPQSYNFAGNLIVVNKEQVTPLQAESGAVMAFIVSGGIATKGIGIPE